MKQKLKQGLALTFTTAMMSSGLVGFNQANIHAMEKQLNELSVSKIASYSTGATNKDGGVAEIIKYNHDNQKFYLVNGYNQRIDIVSLANLNNHETLVSESFIDVASMVNSETFEYGDLTSTDIHTNQQIIVAAVQAKGYADSGKVVVLDYEGKLLKMFDVGIQPDMVKITSDGRYILTANEGEPRLGLENAIDPEGAVSIINLNDGSLKQVKFDNESVIDEAVIIRNTEGGAITDLEPEYITLSSDQTKAYVALQENNAIATINIQTGELLSVKSLGFKDHSVEGNGIDGARDHQINIETLPVLGAYMPDGIATVTINGVDYLVTANEGDGTEWEEFTRLTKFGEIKYNLTLDASYYAGMTQEEVDTKFEMMKASDVYDKLEVLTGMNGNALYTFGGRSFSIFKADTMELIYDSGDEFEQIVAQTYPEYFNISNNKLEMDARSTKKGPEAEDVKVGQINGCTYAFVGLERMGGVMMYDITDLNNVTFVDYTNTRDFNSEIAGDVAPEGLDFITAENSPTGNALLLVANEVSGTVAVNEFLTTSGEQTPGAENQEEKPTLAPEDMSASDSTNQTETKVNKESSDDKKPETGYGMLPFLFTLGAGSVGTGVALWRKRKNKRFIRQRETNRDHD